MTRNKLLGSEFSLASLRATYIVVVCGTCKNSSRQGIYTCFFNDRATRVTHTVHKSSAHIGPIRDTYARARAWARQREMMDASLVVYTLSAPICAYTQRRRRLSRAIRHASRDFRNCCVRMRWAETMPCSGWRETLGITLETGILTLGMREKIFMLWDDFAVGACDCIVVYGVYARLCDLEGGPSYIYY